MDKHIDPPRNPRQRLNLQLARWVLPLGLLALLTGMFWIGDRSAYHQLYYVAIALPTLLALLNRPRYFVDAGSNGIFLCFLLFSAYTVLSIGWSGTDNSLSSLLKRPLYIALLFYCAGIIALADIDRLRQTLQLGIGLAALAAVISLGCLWLSERPGHLNGYGALYNRLLTSHVYGMFTAMALAGVAVASSRRQLAGWLAALTCLAAAVVMTGSRTPLMALAAALLWLLALNLNRRALCIVAGAIVLAAALFAVNAEGLLKRGLSYRPEIWQQAWLQIAERPWFGYGYDHPMVFWVKGISYAFADPHNIELAVWFSGGLAGLALWLLLYAVAMRLAWRHRRDPLVAVISTALVYGFTAGLTEGNSFMSRPKEHWFLIWIPLALLAAVSQTIKAEAKRHADSQEA